MNFKTLLLLTCVFVVSQVFADQLEVQTRSGRKCLKGNSLAICNNGLFGGSVTAASFGLSPAAAVGTVGVPGVGGDLAYAGVGFYDTSDFPIDNDAAVTFNVAGPLAGVTQSSATTLTVANAGIYRIQAQVTGYQTATNAALVFELQANGSVLFAPFLSPLAAASGAVTVINGFGLVALPAGAVLSVVNVTGATVTIPADVIGAVLTVERIA